MSSKSFSKNKKTFISFDVRLNCIVLCVSSCERKLSGIKCERRLEEKEWKIDEGKKYAEWLHVEKRKEILDGRFL